MTDRNRDTENRQDRPLAHVLNTVFDRLSNTLAGPEGRKHPNEMLPGADDPAEGSIPDEFLPQIETLEWFDPSEWVGLGPDEVPRMDVSRITLSTGGTEGNGLDFFRGGQAPSNWVNRNNPLYAARRDFAVQIAPQLEEMFDVSAEGSAGYIRPPSPSDAAPGGRAENSDHQSGGALDFYGDDAKLTNLRNWLIDQPWVSFVRWQSESHFDHLHVSFDLGWVAQNYFQGRELPPTRREPPPLTAPTNTPGPQATHTRAREGSQAPREPRTAEARPEPPQEIV